MTKVIGTNIRNVMSASTLIGESVENKKHDYIGQIEAIMLDVPHGTIAYAVLSFGGGFFGFGEKLFAVPWEALQLDEDGNCFILNITKEKLENAPGFDKDKWPDMADPEWGGKIYDHFGVKRPARLMKARTKKVM